MKNVFLKSVHQLLNDFWRSKSICSGQSWWYKYYISMGHGSINKITATVLQISGDSCILAIKKFKNTKNYGLGQYSDMKAPYWVNCTIV